MKFWRSSTKLRLLKSKLKGNFCGQGCIKVFLLELWRLQFFGIFRLYSRFTALDKEQKGFLTKNDLLRIPELSINPLGERIVDAFFVDVVDEQINFQQFMQTLAVFRPIKHKERRGAAETANSLDKKLEFAFRVYDVDNDKKISQVGRANKILSFPFKPPPPPYVMHPRVMVHVS